jgi:NAD(P)-dependent dehydrogenase (short-subunit alcohol dehydrogenase family)
MQKPIALILGATGGIGEATRQAFLDAGYRVITVGRAMLDFNLPTAEIKLVELLNSARADVVVNCAGVFVNGTQEDHHLTFNVNFGSNWNIIRYYHAMKDVSKPVKIIMVGSSSYCLGKSQYPLYSASKAALYNLWQSAVDLFAETDISVDLINPMRTRTRMNAKHYDPSLPYHSTTEVAEQILELTRRSGSSCVNMTLEEAK